MDEESDELEENLSSDIDDHNEIYVDEPYDHYDHVFVDPNQLCPQPLALRQQPSHSSSSYEPRSGVDQSLWNRIKAALRWLFAFVFSNVGIIAVVIVYLVAGAFCFQSLEQSKELKQFHMTAVRNRTVQKLWQVTARLNTIFPSRWSEETRAIVSAFQEELVRQVGDGYDGSDRAKEKWTFSGALLYCITVIAAIGYGHITPSTVAGKILTMGYALVGMPLFLLYLSNIGSLLAKSFKFVYTRCLLCHARRGSRLPLPPWIQRADAVEPPEGHMMLDFCPSEENSDCVVGSLHDSVDSVEPASRVSDSMLLGPPETTTVPIVLCLAVMISYILGGAALFARFEGWGYLDGSYFCFITLSTIGFGDIVPGNSIVDEEPGGAEDRFRPVLRLLNVQFVLVTVYILLGMAVIAMCFNLMQEKVVHAVLQAGRILGLVKDGDH